MFILTFTPLDPKMALSLLILLLGMKDEVIYMPDEGTFFFPVLKYVNVSCAGLPPPPRIICCREWGGRFKMRLTILERSTMVGNSI